ncbi:hypothetical protein EJ08DRAFT_397754 [Tothia fuscella]|uniref:Uncharacterized protein n=1 Tax=Tothia fuscella TaxID=1048955 RepID=A0A9P4NKI1_9PEZI|nr:hypothetical protein EJ08DRAFT_397754 [Tothia fuscella]
MECRASQPLTINALLTVRHLSNPLFSRLRSRPLFIAPFSVLFRITGIMSNFLRGSNPSSGSSRSSSQRQNSSSQREYNSNTSRSLGSYRRPQTDSSIYDYGYMTGHTGSTSSSRQSSTSRSTAQDRYTSYGRGDYPASERTPRIDRDIFNNPIDREYLGYRNFGRASARPERDNPRGDVLSGVGTLRDYAVRRRNNIDGSDVLSGTGSRRTYRDDRSRELATPSSRFTIDDFQRRYERY